MMTEADRPRPANGSVAKPLPPWAKFRSEMLQSFPSPFRGAQDPLATGIYHAIRGLDLLKPQASGGPAYLGTDSPLRIDFATVKSARLAPKMETSAEIIKQVINLFEGLPNWGHPLAMNNVMPQSNTAAIVATILSEIFSPDIMENEYAWNIHRAELESGAMLADLAGWESQDAGCVYTYGGSGCWTYHLKYALTRVLPNSRNAGIRTDAKVICSQQAHYTMLNSTDWTGLGMDNIIRIRTDIETNGMDLVHLEEVLKDCQGNGIPVASVVCTMGTTDANAFDPVEDVRVLMDRYPNLPPYGKALLYCDSVIGWAWLVFKNYDFVKNPLGFSQDVLPYLERNFNAIRGIFQADAFGADFHKTGFCPYISSAFVYRDAKEFESLLSRGTQSYLQQRSPYNPMNYTLEVSRAATGSLAGWATLKYFGQEGFQSVLGGVLENKVYLKNQIVRHQDMVCVNASDYGFATLIRIYAQGIDAQAQYQRELCDPNCRQELLEQNKLTEALGNKLFEWFRSGKKIAERFTPYLGFTTGFRAVEYNRDLSDPLGVVCALKMFPLNVNITPADMDHVLACIVAARDELMSAV